MDRPKKPNFNKRQSFNTFWHSHYLTFSTHHRQKYLLDDRICQALAARINEAAKKLNFAVLAYVFMPDHVHLLIHPMNEVYEMEDILKAIKQGPSKRATNRKWILTDLWERGGGYDSNVFSPKARIDCILYILQNPVRKEIVEASWDNRWSSANWYVHGIEGDVKCHFFSTLEFGKPL